MVASKLPSVHSAHCEGHTVVAFSADGRKIFTAGCDNLVRSFGSSLEERSQDALTVDYHSRPVTSLAVTPEFIITGSEDMTVGKIEATTLKALGGVLYGSQKIYGLAQTDPRKQGACLVGILSDVCSIKVLDVNTGDENIFVGMPHPAVSAVFHPDGKGLVALTTQGTLVYWNLADSTTTPSLIKKGKARTSRLTEACDIAMHPTGRFLAVPASCQGYVKILDTVTFEEIRELPFGHSKMVSLIRWSPNGQFLATCGLDQCLVIWKVNTWTKSLVLSIPAMATSMAWSPKQNMIAVTTDSGSLVIYDEILSTMHGFGKHSWETVVDLDSLSEDDEIDELLRHDEDMDMELGMEELSLEEAAVTLQSSFTPGSTQMESSDWQFLTYNAIGGILAQTESAKPLYSVKFHDKGKYSDYQFSDLRRYTFGSLSVHGALFAMQGYLFYKPHGDSDPRSTWEALLPPGEDVVAIVATPRGLVVCTSRGQARFFTCLGLQYHVASLPSTTLLSVASDQGDRLLYVYHRGAELANLRLGYSLLDISSMQRVDQGTLTLSPGAALEWVGFSQDSIPACSDSEGLVQVLSQASAWLPVLRINPGQLFPFSIDRGQVHCLRISSDPSWIEQPIVRQIPWQAYPAITRHSSREESELLLARLETRLGSDNLEQRHLIEDKLLLSLLNTACKADRPKQAVELSMMLNRLESFAFAEKIVLSHGMDDALNRIKQIHAIKANLSATHSNLDIEPSEEPLEEPMEELIPDSPIFTPEVHKPTPKDRGLNPFAVPVKNRDRPVKRLLAADHDDLEHSVLSTHNSKAPRTPILKTPKATILASPRPPSATTTPTVKRPAKKIVCHLPISDDSD